MRSEGAGRPRATGLTRRSSAAAVGVVTGIGLIVLPELFSFPAAHWSEWLGVLAGGVAGWVTGSWSAS